MKKEWLSIKDIAQWFGCGDKRARQIVQKLGVEPMDFGRGRGGGLHWFSDSVIEAARHTTDQGARPAKDRSRHHSILGKSADDLIYEFTGEKDANPKRSDQWQSVRNLRGRGKSTTATQ